MRLPIVLILLTLLSFQSANAYKILALFSFAVKSHLTGFLPLANELASRNNEITIVHPLQGVQIPSQIKSIHLEYKEEFADGMVKNAMEGNVGCPISMMFHFGTGIQNICERIVTHQEIQKLIKAGKQYDIVIVNAIMNECSLAIAPLLGEYIIFFTSGLLPPFLPNPAPHPPSTVPNHILPLTSKMNFFERFQNFMATVGIETMYKFYLMPKTTSVLSQHVPQAPTAWEAWKKLSLILVNQDPVTVSPRPTVPNMVSAYGMACRPAAPVPKELDTFAKSSGDKGTIVFSLGSNAQSRFLPKKVTDAFLGAFKRLKLNVIWKYEDDSLTTPPNVKLVKWMPQQDLLGHPNVRLLITQGGTQSLQEAVYHAVPVIGIPIYGDQPGNVARMKELGIGERLTLDDISEDSVYEAITTVLNNKQYQEKMKKYSNIFKDVLQPQVKKGAFWVEYVARHKGARHLRTLGEDMCIFKYFLIDVIAFVTIVPTITIYLVYRLIRCGCKKFCSKKKTTEAKKKQ